MHPLSDGGWRTPAHDPCNPRIEAAVVHLTPEKLSAVRAAFKVGVKPSQIAWQFGLARSDVPKALAGDRGEPPDFE
jgi:hypothetical protein